MNAARLPALASPDGVPRRVLRGRIEIEVGPGRGGFLLERLVAQPDVAMLGLEIRRKWARIVDDRLRRAGRVEVGDGPQGRTRAEEVAALRERLWMGADVPEVLQPGPAACQERMLDPEGDLSRDGQAVPKEEIVVLMDASGEGVLDRDDAVRGATPLNGGEDIVEGFARKRCGLRAKEGARSDFAVGSGNSLEGDRSHRSGHVSG